MAGTGIVLELSRAEALVLFEFLARGDSALPVEHEAEQTVLWKLEGHLEKALDEALKPNYRDLLAAARKAVAGVQE